MDKNNKLRIYFFPIIVVAILTALDQLSKHIIDKKFKLYETKPIIKDVFHLTYIRNEGMAWGMLSGKRIFFLVITVIILGFCIYVYNKSMQDKKYRDIRVILTILIAGAIGNMIDRFRLSYVIDFFDFRLINFPVFNIADIYVVVSMFCLAFLLLFKYNNDDIDKLFSNKKDNSLNESNSELTNEKDNSINDDNTLDSFDKEN